MLNISNTKGCKGFPRTWTFKILEVVLQTDDGGEYDNEWVVQIVGGQLQARSIAKTVGYKYIGRVRGFDDIYIFSKDIRRPKRKVDSDMTMALRRHKYVLWVEQQRVRRRAKRDLQELQVDKLFNDPFWPEQWSLRTTRNAFAMKMSMKIYEAWKLGYTGKGVVVSVLDDGIEHNNTDLMHNYDPLASYDLNDNDPDPMPSRGDLNRHGTRCAGEIAMAANNSFCGVGIAHGASIGGVRLLDGKVTDRVEAEALSFNLEHVDIYSASWGPNDDGETVEGPGRLAQKAIIKGIQNGRDGKGAVYVWASGNGGFQDDCGCDGYMDSIYTFSVSSVAEDGTFPWYAEKCAATLAATYSTGNDPKRMIVTTDVGNKCTADHSGTSASAPMAAGIIALGLEANPSLTWRDIQHIAAWTSDPTPLLNVNDGWVKNGRGLYVNSRFGFGIMNAEAFVIAAKGWTNVPEQHTCITVFPTFSKREISAKNGAVIKFQTDGCEGQKNEVKSIEHIQLVLDAQYPVRGHLALSITSPQGTRTQLLSVRRNDKSSAGFRHWPFMSVHTWGENPRGIWQLHVSDESGIMKRMSGIVHNITLIVYGTAEEPQHYRNGRNYETNIDGRILERNNVGDARTMLNHVERVISGAIYKQRPDVLDRIIRYIDDIKQRQKRIQIRPYRIGSFKSR